MELTTVFSAAASLIYFIATLTILNKLFHPNGPNKKWVLALGGFAGCFHLASVVFQLFADSSVNFSLPNVISLVAFIITTGMTLSSVRHRANLILPVVYGFSAILLAILSVIPQVASLQIDTSKLVLVSHITFALVAYCVLVIGMLYAFQVAFINYKLKHKKISDVHHLPPLLQVESQLFVILTAGTVCLVGSELIGLLFIDNFFSKANLHKTVLSVIALGFYLVILWGHFIRGWRGKIILLLTTCATAILTLAYFGSRFVKEFLLS